MDYYTLTVRRLNKECREEDYQVWKDYIAQYGVNVILHESVYESNHHQSGVHMHGLLSLSQGFFRKKLQMFGYHVYIQRIEDQEGKAKWCNYIHKYKQLFKDINIFNLINNEDIEEERKTNRIEEQTKTKNV